MSGNLPDIHENRAESPLYGELYPDTNMSQYQSSDTNMDKNGLLGPYYNIHHHTSTYIMFSRVKCLLLYNTYIKMKKNILIHAKSSKPHSSFLLNDLYDEPSPRALPVPENMFPRQGELMLNSGITLNGLLST